MSHFFLVKNEFKFDKASMLKVFKKMHLKTYRHFKLKDYNIYFYEKIDSKNSNIYKNGNDFVLSSGTFFYKDSNLKDSLKEFYNDFIHDTVQKSSIYGHYVILLYINEKIIILNDSLGVQRIFSDSYKNVLSSSFLATWFSSIEPLILNKDAFIEKIISGYITYPETLINKIIDITYESFEDDKICKIHYSFKIGSIPKENELNYQYLEIKKYFNRLLKITGGNKISLGVSGGFDSRLLLGLIKDYPNKYLFTHLTEGVHLKESKIAVELTDRLEENLSVIKTKHPKNIAYNEKLKLLDDLIYYYDGRTANNSGAFSETGTFNYNYQHLKGVYLGLNGKGGEVYRNYYNLKNNKKYSFNSWYSAFVCFPSFKYMFSKNKQSLILGRINKKISNRIAPLNNQWCRWDIQRYYSEIRQADCEGSIISAHNKIVNYISPFLDGNFLSVAYKSFNKLGRFDNFQSELISKVSVKLAIIQSKYGYNLNSKNYSNKIKDIILYMIPFRIKGFKRNESFKKLLRKEVINDEMIISSIKLLQEIDKDIDWEKAYIHYAQKNIVINTSHLLKEAINNNKLILK